jgi:hypothetical protein
MPSAWFNKSKPKGRWFEWLLRSVLPDLGFEVIDTDGWKYGSKKGVDIVINLKKDGKTYRENIEAKYDEMSEETGNVYVELLALEESISPIWIYGLPLKRSDTLYIDSYAMFLSDLAPYSLSLKKTTLGGEFQRKGVLIPRGVFITQPWAKKLRSIEIDSNNSYQTWLSTQRVAA